MLQKAVAELRTEPDQWLMLVQDYALSRQINVLFQDYSKVFSAEEACLKTKTFTQRQIFLDTNSSFFGVLASNKDNYEIRTVFSF